MVTGSIRCLRLTMVPTVSARHVPVYMTGMGAASDRFQFHGQARVFQILHVGNDTIALPATGKGEDTEVFRPDAFEVRIPGSRLLPDEQ